MAISKHYKLSYLQERQSTIRELDLSRVNTIYNNVIALFPLDKQEFKTITTPWAFRCICGSYVVMDFYAVERGQNKSCGCYRKRKGKLQGVFTTLGKSYQTDYQVLEIGSHIRSRDWKIRCNVCGITIDNAYPHEHIYQGRKFCKCSGNYKMPYEEVKEYCHEFVKNTTWNIVSFPDKYTSKQNLRISLKCKVCGYEVNMLYTNFVKERGCADCADAATSVRLQKDTAWFIERASRVHSYKYDYSKSVYTKAREKVEIICNEHEQPFHFWQSPDNHINKGKGCPECKRLRLRYVSFHLARVEENKEFYKTLPSGVYIGELEEGLYKIGLTCLLDKRFKEIKRASGFDIKPLHYTEMNLYEAFMFEHELHKKYEEFNHQFEKSWEGHSECFDLNKMQVEKVIKEIESYKYEL